MEQADDCDGKNLRLEENLSAFRKQIATFSHKN